MGNCKSKTKTNINQYNTHNIMYRKKIYGKSRIDKCPFCGKQAITKNSQGVSVCLTHKHAIMNDLKCACGEYLDIREGKYGYFFICMNCGPQSHTKVYALNEIKDISKKEHPIKDISKKEQPIKDTSKKEHPKAKETIITSDDPNYF